MTTPTAPRTRAERAITHITTADDAPADADGWRRPHPRTVVATGIAIAVIAGVPAAGTALILAYNEAWFAASLLCFGGLAVIAAVTGYDWVLQVRTGYRVTAERVELRSRVFSEQHRTISLDRVRSVDVSADIWSRVVGLRSVTVGTGHNVSALATGSERELTVSLVSAAEADRLRQELLRRRIRTSPLAEAERELADARADLDEAIARLDPRWLGVAPLSVFTPILGVAGVGTAYKLLDWIDQDAAWRGAVEVYQYVLATAVWTIPAAVAALLVAGAVAATALEAEAWWNYRLDRESGGTLRVRRGLLNTKSVSLEESRMRGVELRERLLIRRLGFARVKAIATGLSAKEKHETAAKSDLGPEMPAADAHRVAARALREDHSPVREPRLAAHPRAALRRRLTVVLAGWALLVALAAAPVPFVDRLPWWVAAVPAALLPFAVFYAFDLYRGLGSAVAGRYLLLRRGSLSRRTVALRTDGVIGWTVSRSPFQRTAGLATLGATTASGGGIYRAPDVDLGAGLAMAATAVPGLLAPFLVRR